jgi:hypothetical protein
MRFNAVAYLFIILLLAGSFFVFNMSSVNATGWLLGWTYRKSHVINNATGAGTNYQVKIVVINGTGTDSGGTVYINNKTRTDFGDVRFTGSDGTTLLDYWMQNVNSNVNATFWVEVADDLSSSNVTIYVYYGKSDAMTISNFDNTFIFGDPFSSTTLNTARWTSVDGSPTYSIDATNHYLEVTNMATSQWWSGVGFHSKTGISFSDTYIVEDAYSLNGQKISHYSESKDQIFGAAFEIKNTSNLVVSEGRIGDSWDSNANYVKDAYVGTSSWNSGTLTGSNGTWYNMQTRIWKLAGNIHVELDGTERLNIANSDTSDRVLLEIAQYGTTYGFGTERFYAFKIRKYVSPEPSDGSWGSEESGFEGSYSFSEVVKVLGVNGFGVDRGFGVFSVTNLLSNSLFGVEKGFGVFSVTNLLSNSLFGVEKGFGVFSVSNLSGNGLFGVEKSYVFSSVVKAVDSLLSGVEIHISNFEGFVSGVVKMSGFLGYVFELPVVPSEKVFVIYNPDYNVAYAGLLFGGVGLLCGVFVLFKRKR